MEQESEEEFGEEKEERPSSNLFIDAEADDSENEEESDDETSIKIRLPIKSKTDKFEKVIFIRNLMLKSKLNL